MSSISIVFLAGDGFNDCSEGYGSNLVLLDCGRTMIDWSTVDGEAIYRTVFEDSHGLS